MDKIELQSFVDGPDVTRRDHALLGQALTSIESVATLQKNDLQTFFTAEHFLSNMDFITLVGLIGRVEGGRAPAWCDDFQDKVFDEPRLHGHNCQNWDYHFLNPYEYLALLLAFFVYPSIANQSK